MPAIKAVVIGLGAVILAMTGLVIWGLMRQGQSLSEKVNFADTAVAVPAGCSLAAVEPGKDALLILRLDGPLERGCQQAVLVDGGSGKVVGRIRLKAE
ncbi:hypothetical protein SAMN06265365_12193 [Tistlia consotensis]|uniref:Uncharacterized protein n=1 Tax=Tistlia consotensis USBA 355 TaxID=560819 RepID=A0A1Y6CGI0_9PROT|nr:hypothetical protein [Tistlia consotensis]SMF60251.1 hypothetical protein SAMN05428998_12330 [Tistlia consotensis USBA 355]SNR93660.1 hypothetical protein SAMN06265365_12193 [Tistlia consotensis]